MVEGTELEFPTYEIFRGSDSTSLSYLDEISGDLRVYKDKDPKALETRYYYRVAGVKAEPCYPSANNKADPDPYSRSMSNIEDNRFQPIEGIYDHTLAGSINIYPNPFSEFTTLKFINPNHSIYRLVVRDLSGKMVHMTSDIRENEVILNRDNLMPGYYFVELIGEQVFRGKVIVE